MHVYWIWEEREDVNFDFCGSGYSIKRIWLLRLKFVVVASMIVVMFKIYCPYEFCLGCCERWILFVVDLSFFFKDCCCCCCRRWRLLLFSQLPIPLFFLILLFTRVAFWLKKMVKYTCGVPPPLIKWHISVDLVKIGQKVTFAKGLNHWGQNFHFF